MSRQRLALITAATCLGIACATSFAQTADPAPAATPGNDKRVDNFAVVEGTAIPAAQYGAALNEQIRKKFYHGKPPEAEIDKVRREVGLRLINDILLKREADKLGLTPDTAKVDAEIAKYEKRYSDSSVWKERRETVLPALRQKLELDTLKEKVEAHVKTLPEPGEAEVRAYYEKHPDKFTEPEQVRLAMILLAVDPSSHISVWDLADQEAQKLLDRVTAGEKFEDLAQLHSGDPSADEGGDLGYLHRGMLPEAITQTLDELKLGDVSKPVRILEGVAIFKLIDRKETVHHAFERVRVRASELYSRERAEQTWQEYLDNLSKRYKVEIDTETFPAFADLAS